ncbi:hypothetical protein [Saliterribacillus persicus]|uniref:hypothetical protein n=1 Tax=Saliterribacillus persicus TaxID=930114 RepID=UPI0011C01750|nr:hypothetical protein [Saliterribacillus persicus]
MKKYSWLSYCSFVLSLFPIPFLFGMMYAVIRIHPSLGFFLISLSIILSLLLGLIALFKRTEKNALALVAIIISFWSGLFFIFGLLMSQMA